MIRVRHNFTMLIAVSMSLAIVVLVACSSAEPVEVIKEVVVEVPVEKIVTMEVVKEVPVERIVKQEVIKEVPKEVVVEKQVVKTVEIPVERIVKQEVIKEVPKEVVVEKIVKEEVIKTVERVVVATPTAFEARDYASAADGRRGGTLKTVSQASIATIDPISSSTWVAWAVSTQIYDVPFASDGDFKPQLQMLEDWSISDDGLVWSFTHRDGLLFHDGSPVTAEDTKATLERSFDSYNNSWKELGRRATVGVVDDHTWTLNFEEPFSLVLDAINFNTEGFPIQKASVIEGLAADRGGGLQEHVGSGPYKFVDWDVGNRVILERFEDYLPRSEAPSGHAGAKYAYVDKIEYYEIPDVQTRLSLLETREVDFIDTAPLDFFEIMRDNPDIEVYTDPIGRWPVMVLNHRRLPFSDVKARKALQAAINNEAIMAAYGPPGLRGLCSAVFLCGLRWDTRIGEENYNQNDVPKAMKLLAESTYDGRPVVAMTPVDQPTIHPILTVSEQNLRDTGFNLDLQVVDWATLRTRRAKPDDWDIFTTWGAAGGATPLTNTLGVGGLGGFESDRITDLRQRFFTTSSDEEKEALIEQLQLAYYEEVPYVVIGFFSGIHAAGVWVRGFDSRALWPAYWNVWLEE